jgi:hypothetical protein
VCFFQLAVSNIPHSYYINFLSVKGESVQEWQLLESEVLKLKDHLQPLPQEKARFMDLLLQKTYAI